MIHHDSCPLCASDKISLLFNCTDHFISKDSFGIFRCSACGFVFTQDFPGESEIGKYYESEEYISHSDTSKGLSNKIYRLARNIMLRRKKSIVQKVTGLKKGNLLDIGSGTGYFAGTMKQAGWHVKGIEINEKARNFSSDRFGIETSGPENLADLQTATFDCITLWHVLEHFNDPFKYAAEIHRLLRSEGICVIALPNSASYDAAHYGRFWAAFDAPRHLWHFNPDTFRLFSQKTGFKLEKIMSLPLDVFYISMLSEKYKGSGFTFLKGIAKAKWFTLKAFFNIEKSSSIIYILSK